MALTISLEEILKQQTGGSVLALLAGVRFIYWFHRNILVNGLKGLYDANSNYITDFLAFFMLLLLTLSTYVHFTDNFSLLPYVQFILSCSFILLGINEYPVFFVSSLIFFFLISNSFATCRIKFRSI